MQNSSGTKVWGICAGAMVFAAVAIPAQAQLAGSPETVAAAHTPLATTGTSGTDGLLGAIAIGSAVANVGLFAIALLALMVARKQVRVSREIEAINAYEKYHNLSIEYPALATGFNISEASSEEVNRYIFFVMSMFLTIERILKLFPRDREWQAAFEDDLRRHVNFLGSELFATHKRSMDPQVVKFIESLAKRNKWVLWRGPATNSATVSAKLDHADELLNDSLAVGAQRPI